MKKIGFPLSKGKAKEKSMQIVFTGCAVFSVGALVTICVYLFAGAAPAFAEIGFFRFLFGSSWSPSIGEYGILPMIVGSLAVTAGAIVIGVGVGVFAAVCLSKFCRPRLKRILSQVVNLLAGIPSVIYGFFGLTIIVPFFREISSSGVGYGIMSCSVILGIMILPTVISISKNALDNVPAAYYEGAVALGAKKEQAVFHIVLPAAKSGIFTSAVLGVGRAIGETMAVILIAGNSPVFPQSLFQSIRTLTGNIVLEMGDSSGLHMDALIACGSVLFIFVLILTLMLNLLKKGNGGRTGARKLKKKRGSGELKKPLLTKVSKGWNQSFVFSKQNRSLFQKENQVCEDGIALQYQCKSAKAGALKFVSFACAALTAVSLAGILAFVLIQGLPHLTADFLFGTYEYGGNISIVPSLVSTLMMIFLTLFLALPIGVFSAVYLVEYAKQGAIVKIIRCAIETLAGIPSIIYGLFGLLFFVRGLGLGYSILGGCLTLMIMVLPTLIRATEEALLDVPSAYREASYALGAGKTRTLFKVILPCALSGIVNAAILSVGRIVGESAALIHTAGSTPTMPAGYLSSGSSLAVSMYVLASEGIHINEAYATAVVLIVLVLALNTFSSLLEKRFKKGENTIVKEFSKKRKESKNNRL